MLFFLNVGHVTVGAVTLDVFPKASNGKNAWIGFTLGFDPFHVCGYTAINSLRVRKNLNPVSPQNVVVNKGKFSLNSQKYGFTKIVPTTS